jgi:hypothetical protein
MALITRLGTVLVAADAAKVAVRTTLLMGMAIDTRERARVACRMALHARAVVRPRQGKVVLERRRSPRRCRMTLLATVR